MDFKNPDGSAPILLAGMNMHLPVIKYLYEIGGYEGNSTGIETNVTKVETTNWEVDKTWTKNPWDRILRILDETSA